MTPRGSRRRRPLAHAPRTATVLIVASSLSLLAACSGTPDLSGRWEGRVSNPEDQSDFFDVSMSLEQRAEGELTGEGNASIEGENYLFEIERGSVQDDGSFSFLMGGASDKSLRFEGESESRDRLEGRVTGGGDEGPADFVADKKWRGRGLLIGYLATT